MDESDAPLTDREPEPDLPTGPAPAAATADASPRAVDLPPAAPDLDAVIGDIAKQGRAGLQPSPIAAPLLDIALPVDVVLATLNLPINQLAAMAEGTEIDLDRPAGDPVSVRVNGREIATGELVVIEPASGRLGIRLHRLGASPVS